MRWALGLLTIVVPLPAGTADPDYFSKVETVLRARCHGCHGAAQQMNGVRLDEREAALRGGYSGPVILPGNSGSSKLIQRVSSTKKGFAMPPAGPPLTAGELALLRNWIDAGANWPSAPVKAQPPPAPVNTHWSFRPRTRPDVPAAGNRAWIRNPIDAFVLAKLDGLGIPPSPEAAKRTLIRRLSLDLTGLPPAPEEVAGFLTDNRPDAYERVVDRLLASPHYGEKWARHWLDLARYADSDGYEKDLVRPGAWRYRHWVIEALNRDLPFDRFTVEQLAGDLLPDATVEQRVATGFQRNALTNREAGVDRAEARFEQLVNRTNTTATVWLGLTAGCAQCHNHKYDPITQKDYYQMLAFWDRTDEEDIDAPLPGEMGPYLAARPAYERKRADVLAGSGIAGLQAGWEASMRKAMAEPGKNLEWDFAVTSFRAMVDSGEKLLKLDPAKRSGRQARLLTWYFLRSPGPDLARDKAASASIRDVREMLGELDSTVPWPSEAQVLRADPAPGKSHVRLRGDYRAPGIEVEPGTPAFLPPLPASATPDRLALARWLIAPDNPLTARVAVNRMWQEFFGRGLVRTSEDFGAQGEKPSHPELLDWLASEFVEGGWGVKRMHRLIVTSATYRQSSNVRPELIQRDPENSLLARQSRLRLPAELIRDAALTAGGLLNPAIGGRSVRPPQPAGVAELGYANSVKWKESTGMDRYRRGLYIHFQRTTPYPQLMNFDAPDSNVSCSRRRVSNSPLQALNLLNDPVFFEAAQGLAERLGEAPEARRLDYAFELTLARPPGARERQRLAAFLEKQGGGAWLGVCRILLNLDEFITRE